MQQTLGKIAQLLKLCRFALQRKGYAFVHGGVLKILALVMGIAFFIAAAYVFRDYLAGLFEVVKNLGKILRKIADVIV